MNTIKFASIFVSALLLVSCMRTEVTGSGNLTQESRPVGSVTVVDVCCGMELVLSQDDEQSLTISAEENLIDDIVDRQSGSTLHIEFRDSLTRFYRPTRDVTIFLTLAEIESVKISGGGRLEAESIDAESFSVDLSGGSAANLGSLAANELDVSISGGGSFQSTNLAVDTSSFDLSGGSIAAIELLEGRDALFSISGGGRVDGDTVEVDALEFDLSGGSNASIDDYEGREIETDISGGGWAEIGGDTERHIIKLSGGSEFRGADLRTRNITIEGNGDATVWATGTLEVDLSGGATVEYFGDPQISSDLSGGSEVKPLGGR